MSALNVQNLGWLIDQNAVAAHAVAKAKAADALEKYIDARREMNELEAQIEVRVAMGAEVVGVPVADVRPIRRGEVSTA